MDDVLFIYEWFRKVASSYGKRISEPQCSDISKTYPYRTVSKFVAKAKETGLDKEQMQALVKEIVKYAKDKKLLHRGTAILTMADIFSICCKRIEADLETSDLFFESVREAAKEISQDMHLPVSIGGYPKLIQLINSDQLPIELVAVSKTCVDAMQRISQEDRGILPSNIDLLRIRIGMLIDVGRRSVLKEILGNDLLETGVPR